MAKKQELTEEQKQEIINDFTTWTGGWSPTESDGTEIRKYIRYTLSIDLPQAAAKRFLKSFYEKEE